MSVHPGRNPPAYGKSWVAWIEFVNLGWGFTMRKALRTGAAVLAMSCMAANAWAAGPTCAKPQEAKALQTAAIQQRLMVAALYCDAAAAYNRFVVSYRQDLQSSDSALQSFFRRLNASTGTADYHAYKTHLANMASMQSISNMPEYCANANAVFNAALAADKKTLVAFLSSQPESPDSNFPVCETQFAGGNAAPAAAPLPREKPLDAVVPAQGGN